MGIKDPIEKSNGFLREQTVKLNFLKTVQFSKAKRYSVDLPWIDDHVSVSRNLELAKKRLENTVKKLKREGIYEEYNAVFSGWEKGGIIEIVPESEIDSASHCLPHHAVVKPESTTKI